MESEMDAELRFHMEAYAEDLMRGGVQREEAMRRARLEFGEIHCLDAVRRIAPRSAHVPWGDRAISRRIGDRVRCASAAGKPR